MPLLHQDPEPEPGAGADPDPQHCSGLPDKLLQFECECVSVCVVVGK